MLFYFAKNVQYLQKVNLSLKCVIKNNCISSKVSHGYFVNLFLYIFFMYLLNGCAAIFIISILLEMSLYVGGPVSILVEYKIDLFVLLSVFLSIFLALTNFFAKNRPIVSNFEHGFNVRKTNLCF